MEYNKLKKDILEKLRQGLSNELFYHRAEHSIQVINDAEIIGKAEGFKEDELVLLKTAALLHDIGFLKRASQNESMGSEMAASILPDYAYDSKQIKLIQGMILATAIPQKPQNLMEEIICDADLAYLGQEDATHHAENLQREMSLVQNLNFNDVEWIDFQLKFLKMHSFFTSYARNHLDPGKQRYIQTLEMRKQFLGGEISEEMSK